MFAKWEKLGETILMNSVLVTGGAGFIGSHLVGHLLETGWNVTTIDNFDPFYAREDKLLNLSGYRARRNLRVLELDVRNYPELIAHAAGRYDVIVHLAAKAGVRPSIADPGDYVETNVNGTQNMLSFARHCGTPQFVFASSSSVYGVNPRVPWSEDDHVLMPISPYAATKVSGELLGHVYAQLFGIRFIALRFFTVYGPRQRPDLAIHRFARMMEQRLPIPVFGDGSTRRDYTYVEEVVQGIAAAMQYDRTPFEVINLGSHRTVALTELIETLEDALGVKAALRYEPEQPGDVPQTYADVTKARALLGFEPRMPFPTGIENFARWLRERDSLMAKVA